MDKETAIRQLKAIAKLSMAGGGDKEADHCNADEILIDFLRDNGHADLAQAWEDCREDVGFWYA